MKIELEDNFEIRYEAWKWGGRSEGYKAWHLYKDGIPVAGIANDKSRKDDILIRHIESKEKGMGSKLVLELLNKGVIIETGKPGYNSISTRAYYMNKKITNVMLKDKNFDFTVLGKPDNEEIDPVSNYEEIAGKRDVYHYRWFKK